LAEKASGKRSMSHLSR